MVVKSRKKRAAIYARMSDPRQDANILRQLAQARAYAERAGYEVVGVYTDDGIPGDEFERLEGLQRLIRDAAEGKFDVIITDEQSRISRQDALEFLVRVVYPLREAAVVLETAKEGPVPWEGVVNLIMVILNQDKNAEEPKKLSYRVLTGMMEKALQGFWMGGKAPYGFRVKAVMEGEKKIGATLVLFPSEAQVMREGFLAYLAGEKGSLRAVGRWLNERGVRPPGGGTAWGVKAVKRAFRNPVYKGALAWNRSTVAKYHRLIEKVTPIDKKTDKKPGKKPDKRKRRWNDKEWVIVKDGAFPAAVEPSLWDAVNKLLDERGEKTERAPHKSPNANAFTLSGLLRCGVCDSAMTGVVRYTRREFKCPGCKTRRVATVRPGKTEETCRCGHTFPVPEGGHSWSVYQCNSGHLYGKSGRRNGGKGCRCRAIEEADVLHLIGTDLEEQIGEPDSWRKEVVKLLQKSAKKDPARLAEKRHTLGKVKGQIEQATERYLTVPPEFAAAARKAMDSLQLEKERLEAEVKSLSESVAITEDIAAVADRIVEHLRLLRFHLATGEREKVRPVIQRFVQRVTIEFDAEAKSASEVRAVRIKYRDDAFTVRNLLPSCVAILDPSGRVSDLDTHGQPNDIASAVVFLASEAAAYVTGQALIVDGGGRV